MRASLRRRSLLLAFLVGLSVLVAVMTLGITNLRLERTSDRLLQQMQTVQASQQVWSALLYHDAVQAAYQATGDARYRKEAEQTSLRIRTLVGRLRTGPSSPEEAATIDELARAIDAYLRSPRPEPGTVEETTGRALELERELAMRVTDLAIDQANATIAVNQRWVRVASLLGLGVLAAVAVLLALTLLGVRWQVIAPLRSVRKAVLHFRPNEPFEPAPERGVKEIQDISHSFNETAAALKRQRKVSLNFIAGVAHDLRNPLNALALAAATVRPDRPLPPEEKIRERFELIARQVQRLNHQVEDLLDTTRVEAGELSLSFGEHDLGELAREAVELHRAVSERHTLVTDVPDSPVRVRCDAARMSQVLNNLLSNAIKYSPDGGVVQVAIGTEAGCAWVEVTDFGVGIAEEELQAIFEPFRRSELATHDIPGVGLGLSVSRRIVEAHGGSIEVESEPGQGSTFRVFLPRVQHDWQPMHP